MEKILVTTKDLMEILKISEDTILELIRSGRFPKPVDIGIKRNLWRLTDVEDWAKSLPVRTKDLNDLSY